MAKSTTAQLAERVSALEGNIAQILAAVTGQPAAVETPKATPVENKPASRIHQGIEFTTYGDKQSPVVAVKTSFGNLMVGKRKLRMFFEAVDKHGDMLRKWAFSE